MLDNTFRFIHGFGLSYQFNVFYHGEKANREGGRDYRAAFSSFLQMEILVRQVSYAALAVWKTQIKRIGLLPIACLAIRLSCAAVKQNGLQIKGISQICDLVSEHHNRAMFLVSVASSVALFAAGHYVFAAASCAAIAYDCIDQAGAVSRKVGMVFESYLPYIWSVPSLIVGSWALKIYSATILVPGVIAPLRNVLFEKIETLVGKLINQESPLLKDCNASLQEKKHLTEDEIREIVYGEDDDFEINPSHCSQHLFDENSLPINQDFDQLLVLFDRINWVELDMTRLPSFPKDQTPKHVVDQARNQIVELVKLLKREKRAHTHLQNEVAVRNWGKIVPYLMGLEKEAIGLISSKGSAERGKARSKRSGLNEEAMAPAMADEEDRSGEAAAGRTLDEIKPIAEKEKLADCLLRIAFEGEEISGELIVDMIRRHSMTAEPSDDFGMQLKKRLYATRLAILRFNLRKWVKAEDPQLIRSAYSMGVNVLSAGFLPYSKQNFSHYLYINYLIHFPMIRDILFKGYANSLPWTIQSIWDQGFKDHVADLIRNNPKLSPETQKRFASLDDKSSQRLLCVMLGILRKKKIACQIK